MAQYVYTMNRVSKVVPPNRTLIKDISLSFFPGAKIGVLGLNGAGKSTVLRIMAGVDHEYDGEARPQPGIRIGYLSQEPELPEDETVREAVMEGVGELRDMLERFDEISEKFAEPMSDDEMNELLAEQAELQDKIDSAGGWELDRTLEVAADALRLPEWETEIKVLSGGERRRVALCRLLLSKPDMLLLDEPTNHLDAESVAWLERFLHEFPGTVMAVTHDRYFLDNVAGWILEMDRGHGIPFQGNYSSWLEQKEARLAMEEKQEQARKRTIKEELEWVRSNAKGRQSKSKARLKQFEELNSREFQTRNETQQIYIPPGPRLGDQVIEASNVTKAFGDKLLIEDLSFKVPQGAIVGIIGGNGAGKTTLFKMIAGTETPDSGDIKLGSTVQLGYVDQKRDSLDARRADQRPRRRDAARARGSAAGVSRLRARDVARPLVPRPHRHPRARLRGRLARRVVRGQLHRVRKGPQAAQGRPGRPAPDPVQAHRRLADKAGRGPGRCRRKAVARRTRRRREEHEASEIQDSLRGLRALFVQLLVAGSARPIASSCGSGEFAARFFRGRSRSVRARPGCAGGSNGRERSPSRDDSGPIVTWTSGDPFFS